MRESRAAEWMVHIFLEVRQESAWLHGGVTFIWRTVLSLNSLIYVTWNALHTSSLLRRKTFSVFRMLSGGWGQQVRQAVRITESCTAAVPDRVGWRASGLPSTCCPLLKAPPTPSTEGSNNPLALAYPSHPFLQRRPTSLLRLSLTYCSHFGKE